MRISNWALSAECGVETAGLPQNVSRIQRTGRKSMTKCRFRILPCPVVFVSNAVAKFITPPSSHGNRLLQHFVARTLCFRSGQQLRLWRSNRCYQQCGHHGLLLWLWITCIFNAPPADLAIARCWY